MRRSRLSWLLVALLALLASLRAPVGILAEMRADRCCAENCPEHRSAAMKAECCGVDLRLTAEANVSRLLPAALPAEAPSFVAFFVTDGSRVSTPSLAPEIPDHGTGPPIFLALRTLRI